jgi:hypothetical protein
VVVGDLNGDGKLDLVIANSGSHGVSVLLGKGDGTFAAEVDYATTWHPETDGLYLSLGRFSTSSLALGDLNGDGKLDLADGTTVLYGTGDGRFSAVGGSSVGSAPIVVGDLNGDGRPDLVTTSGDILRVLLGKAGGALAAPDINKVDYPTRLQASTMALVDLDGNGKLDIVAANVIPGESAVSVLLGMDDGTFATNVDYPTAESPLSMALGDLDGDGKLDVATANSGADSVSVLLGKGDGSFAPRVDISLAGSTRTIPVSIALGDLDGDGHTDIVCATVETSSVSVLLGRGNAAFAAKVEYATGAKPVALALGDLSGDGKLDLVTANSDAKTVGVLLGRGDGTFAAIVEYPTGGQPRSVALGDFDRDGKLDVVTGNPDTKTVSVLLGRGDGTLAARVDSPGRFAVGSIVLGDVNGDGKLDIVTGSYLLLGTGDGRFAAELGYATGASDLTSVALGDLNADGRLDLVAASSLDKVSVLWGSCQ